MSGVPLQVAGQVDNGDGLERTFFHAYTAADAQLLGNPSDLIGGRHLDTQLA